MVRILLIVCVWMLIGCAEEADEGPGQPASILAFPSSVALTPESAEIPQRLLVVSSNFNVRYRSGLLHAFDRETIDRLVDEALADACPGAEDACLPVGVLNLAPALVGAVEIGNFGGEVVVAPLEPGSLRAFVPVRGSGSVIAVDLEGERIRCAAGGTDCRGKGLVHPRPDPYSATVVLGRLYVGHNTLRQEETGALGTLEVDDPAWIRGIGGLTSIEAADSALGGVTSGACREEDGVETCTVFATGRAVLEGLQQVVAFDVTEDAAQAGPLQIRNLFSQQRGTDSRGAALSSDGNRLYFASRFPDALAQVDVTRIETPSADGCLLPEGEAPEGACPDLPPPTGERPRFATLDLSPAPPGPNTVRVIPRTLGDEEGSDLIALTTSGGLVFYDGRTGTLVAKLDDVGSAPSDVAVHRRDEGLRLYVPSFGQGTLAVVDMPDPLRPEGARVVAVLGRVQEEGF